MVLEEALPLLRRGGRIARAGWNGKGMFLFIRHGRVEGADAGIAKTAGVPLGAPVRIRPYVMMKDAEGALVPWLCSQTDLLAEDWRLVD